MQRVDPDILEQYESSYFKLNLVEFFQTRGERSGHHDTTDMARVSLLEKSKTRSKGWHVYREELIMPKLSGFDYAKEL